jgi:hypothetical protein
VVVVVLGLLALLVRGLGDDLPPPDRYLTTHLLVGAWLGLSGAVLVGLAVGVLAAPSTMDRPPSTMDRPASADVPSTVDGLAPDGFAWPARPAWPPRLRRGPLAALASAALALAVVAGLVGWLAAQGPREPRDHSGDLHRFLPPIPDGAAVPVLPVPTGTGNVEIAVVQTNGQAVAEDWYRPGHRDQLTVILHRYDSAALARDALARQYLVESSTSNVVDVPGIPDAHAFTRHSWAAVTGVCGDVLYSVVDSGDGVTVAGVVPLARDEYDRL